MPPAASRWGVLIHPTRETVLFQASARFSSSKHTQNLPEMTGFALQHVSSKFAIPFHSRAWQALTPSWMWGMMHAY